MVGLGGLARWWLRPEVLEMAARLQPPWADAILALPRPAPSLGGCLIALVSRRPADLPLLRPAFLLPVRWLRDRPHDPCLPRSLRLLAGEIAGGVADATGTGHSWGLAADLGPGGDTIDLNGLESSFDSAWAPLAAGLLLAAEGLCPDPGAWATAAWDPASGAGAVEGLAAKLALAEEFGARVVFLPLQQRAEAESWLAARPGARVRLDSVVGIPALGPAGEA